MGRNCVLAIEMSSIAMQQFSVGEASFVPLVILGHNHSEVEDPLQTLFLISIRYKSMEWLGKQRMQTYPARLLTLEEVISKNLAFLYCSPRIEAIFSTIRDAHTTPTAKTFYCTPCRTAWILSK